MMSVSIGGLFLAGVVPGLLIALFMMATVMIALIFYVRNAMADQDNG